MEGLFKNRCQNWSMDVAARTSKQNPIAKGSNQIQYVQLFWPISWYKSGQNQTKTTPTFIHDYKSSPHEHMFLRKIVRVWKMFAKF